MGRLDLLAGIIGSDGHLSKQQPAVYVINKDKKFLENTVKPLLEEFTNKQVKLKFRTDGFGKGNYWIQVYSPWLWKILIKKYRIPPGKKSTIVEPPHLTTNEEKIDFFRGWFAGDGSYG